MHKFGLALGCEKVRDLRFVTLCPLTYRMEY